MEVFEGILLMLAMVLASNIINRFLPNLAIPLIQIALGILLALPLTPVKFELSPELFMLLFLAPLLFNDGANVDKRALWHERKAVFTLSIGLVFVTVVVLGVFIHWLIPSLPWAGSFALAAALAPTDAVAVSALAEKVNIPHKMLHTLEGESLINDASGLVSFQFAVAALLTGTFSLANASLSFVLISLGGVLVGIIGSLLAMGLVKWLRSLGIENTVSFILLELLLPFGIFLLAEKLEVNGILAVVSAGLVYSLSYQKVNPEIAQLNLLSKNTWSIFTFSLNGLVFVLLGTQLPSVIRVVWENNNLNNGTLILYVLGITVILLGVRLLCFLLFKNFENGQELTKKEKWQQSLLYTISGVRGTITLVSALTLPLIINGGQIFMERELLISLAAGVILSTLLLANFTMPLFAEKRETQPAETDHHQEVAILRQVTLQLKAQETPENQRMIAKVVKMYNDRIISLINAKELNGSYEQLMELVLKWQFKDTLQQVTDRKINLQIAFRQLRRLNRRLYHLTKEESYRNNLFYSRVIRHKLRFLRIRPLNFDERQEQRRYLQESNLSFIIEQLEALPRNDFPQEVVDTYLRRYRQSSPVRTFTGADATSGLDEWLEYAIQLEREGIQQAFEQGLINRSEMKTYRENLLAIENTVQFIN